MKNKKLLKVSLTARFYPRLPEFCPTGILMPVSYLVPRAVVCGNFSGPRKVVLRVNASNPQHRAPFGFFVSAFLVGLNPA